MTDPKVDVVESVMLPNSDIESSRMAFLFKSLLSNLPSDEKEKYIRHHNESMVFVSSIEKSLEEIISLIPLRSDTDSIAEDEEDEILDDSDEEEADL